MTQKSLENFNNGFFTMSGALAALVLFYPLYHTSRTVCNFFKKRLPTDK